MPDVFSVPIFFIVFRETLEAAIIVSVLLALADQIATLKSSTVSTLVPGTVVTPQEEKKEGSSDHDVPSLNHGTNSTTNEVNHELVKKMRWQIFWGTFTGLLIALVIGAAFLAVWFTRLTSLFENNEDAWEGSLNLIAAVIIFVMGITMLGIEKSKSKWRRRLELAFAGEASSSDLPWYKRYNPFSTEKWSGGRWALFLLPFITVLREGLEAVVFIGGVSLGQKATAIPLAAIIGILCGVLVGLIIYFSSSKTTITVFLIFSTNLLLLVGAGLFSKAIGNFEMQKFKAIAGGEAVEAGNGPGSYDVRGMVWHLNCCSPEAKFEEQGWTVFTAIFGWSNNGSVGTILGYIFYWIAVIVALVVMRVFERKKANKAESA